MKDLTVNGELVRADQVRARAAQIRLEREAAVGPLSLEARLALQDKARQYLVDRLLMVQEARHLSLTASEAEINAALGGREGCRADADTTAVREDIGSRICIDKVLNHWRATVRRPKLSELREYYKRNEQAFHAPETIHAAHIVCQFESGANEEAAHGKAENLRAQVAAGQAFGQVAAWHSDCPERQGDLGWFARGLMVQEFDDAVFDAPLGQLTPVFRTTFGFHFATVHARKPAGIRPFEEVRSRIENGLWLGRQDQEVLRALAASEAKAVIRSVS